LLPAPDICERARLARDERFDGRFVTAVVTTGVYCRPVCPARPPAAANVRYYRTPAAAQDAGFRPCLRCRPEQARQLPEWSLGNGTVVRGLRLIEAGLLDEAPLAELAAALGVSTRHLNRLFQGELGATPASLARTRRVQLAKRLIDTTTLPLASVAMHAGFGSVRRFNSELKAAYGRPPSALRRGRGSRRPGDRLRLTLPVRQPFDAPWVFAFLGTRALAGLEAVQGLRYRRLLAPELGAAGWLEVRWQDGALVLDAPSLERWPLAELLPRLRRVFDLAADPAVIAEHLAQDDRFAPVCRGCAGLRVPGAWDGFETAVRAVLGQQVSVARATALAQALVARFGDGGFPTPAVLARADVSAIGMPGQRGEAVRALARAVADGELRLDETAGADELEAALRALPGIGPWTAAYIGMRVARDPDAFPASDWVVLKMLDATPGQARRLAQRWRPWRAYAVMWLWHEAERARRAGTWHSDKRSAAPTRRR